MSRATKIIEDLNESWIGNTLIPELQDIMDNGQAIETRIKALAGVRIHKGSTYKKIANWLDSIDDEDYAKFYQQWLADYQK